MRIIEMKTNRIVNPLGFNLGKPKLSYVVTDTNALKQTAANIEVSLDREFNNIIYTTGKSENVNSLAFEFPLELKSCTRYYWRVTVYTDKDESATSDVAWFETAKINEDFEGKWITPALDKNIHPVMLKDFSIDKKVKSARAYVCGLGLYEMNINGEKVGNEYLAPNCNAYDKWLQYQTYDVTNYLGNDNNIEVVLGNGWYKGRFGFEGGKDEIYDDKFSLLCDIVITFEDGTSEVVSTDTSWKCRKSKIQFSGIYDGEILDDTFEDNELHETHESNIGYDRLQPRLSIPVIDKEEIKPVEIIKTPKGETVLDFGQNMAGWVKFKINAPKGTEILLQYGELLQDRNFYRDNLREAKAEFRYISNGTLKEVRPHFTYYGFRYVKVSGLNFDINKDDFTACVLYSDLEETGSIETSNPLVNRLFLNALWGQKSNFVDVPTDCPQRDERMGWTGDAQVFSGTASFNMDSFAFFSKFCYDLYKEQRVRDGKVPMVIPAININEDVSSAWADAATIIPWNMYVQYGDKTILENQFDSMKSWVDYVRGEDAKSGDKRLWLTGFHFGDWLALDGENPNLPTGGTEENFIASAYYYYSSKIVSKAAKVLGKDDLAKEYGTLAEEIRCAIVDEYFTKNGRLALKNQTAYIVALFMEIVPEEHIKRVAKDLNSRLIKDKGYLKTGFVGTPYICRVLSENGYNDMAYKLLLNKNCPSWLYPITMGATTVWERWDSVLPDGKISGTGMNSLNHYSYGSIAEWMYRNMCGINNIEEVPGFKKIKLSPMPDFRFKYVKGKYNSPSGLYESAWKIEDNGELEFKFKIPFDAEAMLSLPDADLNTVIVNDKNLTDTNLIINSDNTICVPSGEYTFKYMPTKSYIKYYDVSMSLGEIIGNEETKKILFDEMKSFEFLDKNMLANMQSLSIIELSHIPVTQITEEQLKNASERLGKVRVKIS